MVLRKNLMLNWQHQNHLKSRKIQRSDAWGNSTDGKLYIKYIGEDSEIDELIVFGFSQTNGFAIIRVLGRRYGTF